MKQAFVINPAVCTPLTGCQLADILKECRNIVSKRPDILEWRADFFEGVREPEQLLKALMELRKAAGALPIIVTIRSAGEGGNQNLELTSAEKIEIYSAICQSKLIDYVDFELSNSPDDVKRIRTFSRDNGIKLILSYHNYKLTPDEQFIREKFLLVEKYGGDVGKVAVMPNSLEDVLDFMKSTLSIQKQIKTPMIAISMGQLGAVSRLFGWLFGSQLTFAIGENSSAPGQIPISDVRAVIDIIQKSQVTLT